MQSAAQHSLIIKQAAKRFGFDFCGISQACELSEDAKRLEKWLNQNHHGTMHYMANHFDKRVDPRKLVEGAKTVITLLYNYYPAQTISQNSGYKISRYAYGQDYHEVIKAKLKAMLNELQTQVGQINGRGFVDSAPILERSWAQRSGLGWIGKNGNLINPKAGSYFFIATLVTDLTCAYDHAIVKDYCGTCTRCIDACPTEAILPNKEIVGSKCISYFTIELKDEQIKSDKAWGEWIFGCDVCQEVCPWNRFSKPHQEPLFEILPEILNLNNKAWEELTEETFQQVFKHSPIKRTKFSGLKRNIKFVQTNKPDKP